MIYNDYNIFRGNAMAKNVVAKTIVMKAKKQARGK
jgi:hypothetical protein